MVVSLLDLSLFKQEETCGYVVKKSGRNRLDVFFVQQKNSTLLKT